VAHRFGAGQASRRLPRCHSLTRYTAERRTALQSLYRHLEEQIEDLDRKVEELAWQRPQAQRLMTHPGVGRITALATETFLGEPWMERQWPAMWD
jgi:transposase